MKIVILTQYFPPEMGAAQNRLIALAKAFVIRGHDTTVLTALPNYPTGKIFEDYKHDYKRKENIAGIKVIRSWLYVNPARSTIPTVLSYLTFALTAYDVGCREIDSADVHLWEYPPIFLGFTALKLAKKWNAKLVTNFADLWTDAMREQKILTFQPALNYLSRKEQQFIDKSDLVLGQTEGILQKIISLNKSYKPEIWPNGADTGLFKPQKTSPEIKNKYNPENKFIVGYAGLHGRNHNLRLIVDTAKELKQNTDMLFLFFGDGYEKDMLEQYAQNNNLTNVRFYDPVPHIQLPSYLSLFDIGIVIHKNLPSLKAVRSAKMFELMAMNIPILYCGESEGNDILKQAKAGVIYQENNPKELAKLIVGFKDSIKSQQSEYGGRKHIIEYFNRQKISESVVEKVEAIAKI